MIITGITGGIGHGKTTFANLLAAQCKSAVHFESWELVAEIASALRTENSLHPKAGDIENINEWLHILPELINSHVHATVEFKDIRLTEKRLKSHPEHYEKLFEYLEFIADNPELAATDITADNKELFRALLQWIGGYLVARIGPGVWYDEIVRRIALLRTSGVELVTVGGVRYPGDAERLRNAGGMILQIQRESQPDQDAQDITERERSDIEADCIVANNGSLADLKKLAQKAYSDLRMRQLQTDYAAVQA